MKTKILVLGSTGMLGHQVVNSFLKFDTYDVIDISFRKKYKDNTIILDVTNKDLLYDTILDIKPNFIINCVGILIKGSNDLGNAIYINSYLPHILKKVANSINSKLIHISTDCVFSGDKGNYKEDDYKDGRDIYSKTKSLGEIIDKDNITIRTSIVGLELKEKGEGLFHWFMNQSGEINGFTKAIWSGVTTLELAKAIKWAIENEITGLYHITNNQLINKYDLLSLFKKYTGKNIKINPIEGKNVNKSFVDTKKEINYIIPSYDVMVRDMVDLMKKSKLYSQYNND